MKRLMAILMTVLMCAMMLPMVASAETYPTPAGYNDNDYQKLVAFFETEDENGVKNGEKMIVDYDPTDPEMLRTVWSYVGSELRATDINLGRAYGDTYTISGVLDLSGCTELRALHCDNLGIEGLNISGCDKLVELSCRGNALTEIDVTNNSKLGIFICTGNALTELDISENTELFHLDCSDNELAELDMTNNPKLAFLYCSNNALTELDVAQLPTLAELYCSGNALTELDVTANPKLKYFHCSDNELTELDVTDNPELGEFYCSGNKLTELDVTNNPILWALYCDNNDLTVIDATQNPDLEELYCNGNRLSDIRTESERIGANHVYANGNGFVEADIYIRIYNNYEEYEEYPEFAANAIPMEGNVFVGWYDAEGNLVSSEAELSLEYGTAYTLEARFEESEAPTDPDPPHRSRRSAQDGCGIRGRRCGHARCGRCIARNAQEKAEVTAQPI